MKTAERILVTSLALFNQRGESNVSSVDIAVELDISPGNLYYHFKGKEVIVAALFELFREQIKTVLSSVVGKQLTVEEFFYFLYMVFDKGHLFQFLFHNTADISAKYPTIGKTFRHQLDALERCVADLMRNFVKQRQIEADEHQIAQIVQLIGLVFTQSANYHGLKGKEMSHQDQLYQSLSCILFAVMPYITIGQDELVHLQEAISAHALADDLHEQDQQNSIQA